MNRFFVIAILVLCSFLSCDALRGALFRSGRSGNRVRPFNIQQQNLNDYILSQKRSVDVDLDDTPASLKYAEQLPIDYIQYH